MWSCVTQGPTRTLLMPPTPVPGAPCRSHDAAETVGIQSDHLSKSMRASNTEAGLAVDGCSTLHDTVADICAERFTAVIRVFSRASPSSVRPWRASSLASYRRGRETGNRSWQLLRGKQFSSKGITRTGPRLLDPRTWPLLRLRLLRCSRRRGMRGTGTCASPTAHHAKVHVTSCSSFPPQTVRSFQSCRRFKGGSRR
jgi:hypothetical protein